MHAFVTQTTSFKATTYTSSNKKRCEIMSLLIFRSYLLRPSFVCFEVLLAVDLQIRRINIVVERSHLL